MRSPLTKIGHTPHNRLISPGGTDTMAKRVCGSVHMLPCSDIGALDILLIPGGEGSCTIIKDEAIMRWVEQIAPGCEWVTSVCTGAFILSKAGGSMGVAQQCTGPPSRKFERLNMGGTFGPECPLSARWKRQDRGGHISGD